MDPTLKIKANDEYQKGLNFGEWNEQSHWKMLESVVDSTANTVICEPTRTNRLLRSINHFWPTASDHTSTT
jgi:hypothetical protein